MSDQHGLDCGCREYQELSRRQFLSTAAGASGAVAAAAVFPDWLPRVVLANHYSSSRDIIVSVFQRGGADGLSLCVPYADANYYAGRATIAIPRPDDTSVPAAARVTALDNYFGFPPAMLGLLPAFAAGHLLVTHATGQTNNSRSHFDAQRFMEVGKPADPSVVTGWLGRHLQTVPPIRSDAVLRGIGFSAGLQRTLVGAPKTLPISDPSNYSIGGSTSTRAARQAVIQGDYALTQDPLKSAALDAINTIGLLSTLNFNGYVPANGVTYPNSSFGRALKSVAVLIKNDVGIEAAQIDVGAWDTHATQDPNAGSMFNTMLDYSASLGAFWADVIMSGFPVTLVSISEFGRNVRENGSAGTDHGRATAMFAMGTAINGGRVFTNGWPGLAHEQLEDGQDLHVTLDYRDILSEIIANRLENAASLPAIFPTWTPTFHGVTR